MSKDKAAILDYRILLFTQIGLFLNFQCNLVSTRDPKKLQLKPSGFAFGITMAFKGHLWWSISIGHLWELDQLDIACNSIIIFIHFFSLNLFIQQVGVVII